MSAVEQRLAEIEGAIPSAAEVRWLIRLVRSLLLVVEAAEELVAARASASKDAWLAKERLKAALEAYREESEGK